MRRTNNGFLAKCLRTLFASINRGLSAFGYAIYAVPLERNSDRILTVAGYLSLISNLPPDYLSKSKSQHGQDLLVIRLLGSRAGKGFFVEFGAVNGVHNSNTLFLEKHLSWSGVVSEPSKRWHSELMKNRSCHIDTRCVYGETGRMLEFGDTGRWLGGNTLVEFRNRDGANRRFSEVYEVETVSLNDLLIQSQAPAYIDFMSIDTEGSELEALRTFDFSKFQFGLILVEHNHDIEKREAIHVLMNANGYRRLPIDSTISRDDDWYGCDKVYEYFISAMCSQ